MAAPPPSRLDANQVLQGSFDESTGRLRTDSLSTIVNADIDVALDATEDNVAIADPSGNFLAIESDGSINVNSVDGALESTQLQALSELQTIDNSLNDIEARLETFDTNAGMPTSNTLRTAATQVTLDPNGVVTLGTSPGIDDSNSSYTPLGAGVTFTGAWKDLSPYVSISFMVKSDVMSAVNGLKVQFSHDGVTVTRDLTATYIPSDAGLYLTLPVEMKYFRVIFINGATPQSNFVLQTMLDITQAGSATVPINFPINDSNSVIATRAVITGKSTDGTYTNQRSDGVSSGNSSTVTLLAGQTFTGVFEDVLGYANISIVAFSNVASATDGLKLEYSTDGINIDDFDSFTVSASNGTQVSSGATSKYFRVRYTNGSTNQTTFRLQTVYHITAPKSSTHRIDDSINGENDAELSKSVVTGKNPDGQFTNEGTSGVVSSNSSTTPLGIGGVFQAPYFDNASFIASSFYCLTDQNGSLVIETSDDGATVIRTSTFPIVANTPFYISQTSVGRYTRARFTNTSGVAQTIFRLQTMLKTTPISPTALTISTALSSNAVALNSRSILAGQQENGTFSNVGLSNTASVKVAITDRPSEVRSRTKVEARIFNTSLAAASTVVYTVTAGKTLYVESMIISALNNTNAIGEYRVTDGATDKFGYLVGEKAAGVPATSSSSSPALPEPIPFTTNFGVREISGDIILSIYFIGYEE